MIFLREPVPQCIHKRLMNAGPPFTTDETIPDPAPPGFWRNAGARVIGRGEECFAEASRRLENWDFGPGGWCRFIHNGPARKRQPVGVFAKCLGLTVFNVCEVVSTGSFDSANWQSFGVTYATVPSHDMCGAEQFRVDRDRTTDPVRVSIESYSRPQSWIAWLALPYTRSVQRRFVRQTLAALERDLSVCRHRESFTSTG